MNKLYELQEILLTDDRKKLKALRDYLEDPEIQTEMLANRLPEAIHREAKRGSRLTASLEGPIEAGLNSAIRKNPESLAKVLYPVMAPAIRRSITEALRKMIQTINRILDQSFSWRGLTWRLESLKSGLPFHEVVLRHTLLYRVKQVCLIQKESGILIRHVSEGDPEIIDPDATSAMLTAIGDFADDSLIRDRFDNHLETIDLGEYSLWLTHRGSTMLAGIIDGIAPPELRHCFSDALDEIYLVAGKQIENFDGDTDNIPPEVDRLMAECLLSEEKDAEKKHRPSPPLLLAIALLAILTGWLGFQYQSRKSLEKEEQERFQNLVSEIQLLPGITVVEAAQSADGYRIYGLRDPLSDDPERIAQASGYGKNEIDFHFSPVASLEPEFAFRRTMAALKPPETASVSTDGNNITAEGLAPKEWIIQARLLAKSLPDPYFYDDSGLITPEESLLALADKQLDPPDTVRLRTENGILYLSGVATPQWISTVKSRVGEVDAFREIDTSSLQNSDARLLSHLRAKLNPPESVILDVNNGMLILRGTAPLSWIKSIEAQLENQFDLVSIDRKALTADEIVELEQLRQELAVLHIYYELNSHEFSGQADVLEKIVSIARRVAEIDAVIDETVTIHILGFSDGDQSQLFNHHIAEQRANKIAAYLSARHAIPREMLQAGVGPVPDIENRGASLSNRRVDFRISVTKKPKTIGDT